MNLQNKANAIRKTVNTPLAPQAIGPYSQGIETNDFVFFSGQIAINPQTGKLDGDDFASQTQRVLKNIEALLSAQGMTAANVVKTTVFITDMSKFSEVNAEYAKFFSSAPPARSCVAVSALPLGALVEIEIIAAK
ncbi:RidA family protein [Pumilibacter intestinalis]|uniref:RidA family protein n=1 Tax=Pumilibacter intestinalis TaxID=2941511 RepID=UPI00203CED8F|nr:RidA family protein [Pumilibacter intestinalis]